MAGQRRQQSSSGHGRPSLTARPPSSPLPHPLKAKAAAKLAAASSRDLNRVESKKAGKKAEGELKRVRRTRSSSSKRWAAAVRPRSAAAVLPTPAAPLPARLTTLTPRLPSPFPLPPPRPQAAELEEAQAWVDAARATPEGAKKTLPAEMPKGYVPKAVEAAW